jgi:hypothetical protein
VTSIREPGCAVNGLDCAAPFSVIVTPVPPENVITCGDGSGCRSVVPLGGTGHAPYSTVLNVLVAMLSNVTAL